MGSLYTKRGYFFTLMSVSLFAGLVFFLTNHLDFLIVIFNNGKANVPNVAYGLLRIVSSLLLPLVFVFPALIPYMRIRASKVLYIAGGVLHILTSSWVIYFLATQPAGDFFSLEAIEAFQGNTKNAMISAFVFWDTYSWVTIFYSVIYGGMMIYTGISFDDNRVKVRKCIIALLVMRIFLPILYSALFLRRLYTIFWVVNNYAEIISMMAYTAAICIASVSDEAWIDLVWNEQPKQNDEEDEEDANNPGLDKMQPEV